MDRWPHSVEETSAELPEETVGICPFDLKAGQGDKMLQLNKKMCATRFYFLFTNAEEKERLLQPVKSIL